MTTEAAKAKAGMEFRLVERERLQLLYMDGLCIGLLIFSPYGSTSSLVGTASDSATLAEGAVFIAGVVVGIGATYLWQRAKG